MTIFVYLLLYFITAISSCGDDFNQKDDLARLDAIKTEVFQLVGEANCSDIGECRSLPLGAKPCGGPWEYLIFSTADGDTLKIREKVEEYNDWNSVLNDRYGFMSDCDLVGKPQLLCLSGECVDRNKVGGDTP